MEQWNQEKENSHYTSEDIIHENEMYRELYRQNRVEEDEQRQKSRCLWLRAGDKNISFFHNNIKLRRAGNQIEKIVAEGKEISDQEGIKEAAFSHFKYLLSAAPQQSNSFDFLSVVERNHRRSKQRSGPGNIRRRN